MFGEVSVFIGIHILLTVGCIVKKIKHYKAVNWNFLWLILYNDVLILLSIYILGVPNMNYSPQNLCAYYPAEFIALTTVPLMLIGLGMKIIFLCEKAQEDDYGNKSSWRSIWYVLISGFPAWFTLCLVSNRLISLSKWMPLSTIALIILTLLLPLLPRIIIHIRKRR